MPTLNPFGSIDSKLIAQAAHQYGTPLYLYDEPFLISRCRQLLDIPNAFGLTVRYAMKANSTRAILRTIHGQGLKIDASSFGEVKRAIMAGIPCSDIILTTQEVPSGADMQDLKGMMQSGLKYNVCSLLQLRGIGDFAARHGIGLAIRVHPGAGTGETATRNTGDDYACFGIHLTDIGEAVAYAHERGLVFDHVHEHIGSGGDPELWRTNIDAEMDILEEFFPQAGTVSFGGGLKEARMPDETPADVNTLGQCATERIKRYHKVTGRKLRMEIEPGTFVVANAGYIITRVADKKQTGAGGFNFLVLDGGMELNARPLMYGSRHPFYILSGGGKLLSTEFGCIPGDYSAVPAGRCCESGDAQSLSPEGVSVPRPMAEPDVGDIAVIGGAGAYCSSMAPMNYNSHPQAPEVLFTRDRRLVEIRRRQTLEQLMANEL